MSELRTRWRLVAIVEGAGVVRSGLDVELVVDTAADVVVEAIERAARQNGIRLERVDEPAPERSTSNGLRVATRGRLKWAKIGGSSASPMPLRARR